MITFGVFFIYNSDILATSMMFEAFRLGGMWGRGRRYEGRDWAKSVRRLNFIRTACLPASPKAIETPGCHQAGQGNHLGRRDAWGKHGWPLLPVVFFHH